MKRFLNKYMYFILAPISVILSTLFALSLQPIMDECLANLDNDTAKAVEKNILDNIKSGIIMITHRIFDENMAMYDQIIVVDNGRIVCADTWENIKQNISVYTS